MWIEELKNGKFRAVERYKDPLTGKEKKVSVVIEKVTRQTKKNAQGLLNNRIKEIELKGGLADVTLMQLKDFYIESQKETVKKQTWFRNEYMLRHALEIIGGNIYADEITGKTIMVRLRQSGKPYSTLNDYLMRLRAMFRWGFENEYVSDIRFLEKLKDFPDGSRREKLQDKYLESDELKALLEHMHDTRWQLLTEFLALSGLRIGEAMVLDDSDVDDYIHVTKTWRFVDNTIEYDVKTDSSERDVYVQPELADTIRKIRKFRLEDMMKRNYRSNLLFPWKDGEPISYNAYRIYLERHSKAIGHKITPHALRHTHVSLLAEQGISLDIIARRVGHSDSKITRDIYLHITERRKEKDNEAITPLRLLS